MKVIAESVKALTDEQIDAFHKKGWIGPLDAFSTQEVEAVREELQRVSSLDVNDGLKVRNFWNDYLGIHTPLNHHLGYRPLSALFEDKRVIQYLNRLGEEDLLFWRTNIFHRMPGQECIGWHQAVEYYGYHIDETESELVFPKDEDPLNLTVWIALVDIPAEMGTLRFANGSHLAKKFDGIKVPRGETSAYPDEKYFRVDLNPEDELYTKKYDFDENDWEVETVPSVKAGQLVIFTEKVMHCAAASTNHADQERWIVNGRYIRPSVAIHPQRLIDNYDYEYGWDLKKHFCILVSGKDDHKINQVVARD